MRTFTLLLLAITSFFTNTLFSQSGKRIKITNYNQTTIDRMVDAGIDLRCGAIFEEDYIQIELSEQDLYVLNSININYDVLISDLTSFYQAQSNADLPIAIEQLERAKAQSALQRGSVASASIDNFLQYQGCDELEWSVPQNFNLGSMGGCLTYLEAYQEMDDMKTLYPNLISARTDASPATTNQTTWGNTLGTATWAGQSIYYVRITGDESTTPEGTRPQMLFTSMIHSREVSSLMGNIYFMWYLLENYDTDPAIKNLVDNNELYFIPVANPDGLRWNETIAPSGGGLQRKNLRPNAGDTGTVDVNNNVRGVDLNRNFDYFWGTAGSGSSGTPSSNGYRGPSAASEPETQILVDFISARNFKTAVWHHSFANAIPHPYGGNNTFISGRESEMQKWHEDMTRFNRYISGALVFPPANGIADDWMLGGAIDANGSAGSGQNILATTPENGHANEASVSGFWPNPTNILPISQRMVRINLMNIYYGGKYAKFHDLTQSDISSLTSDLKFGIERIGQTPSTFTLTVTPLSSNIVSISPPAPQSGMTILEQRVITASMVLDPGISINDRIRYRVQLADDDGDIFYDTIMEKYYQPTVLFADDPDVDLTINWITSGTWTASSAAGAAYSGTRGIKQGGNAITPYADSSIRTITTTSDFNLSNTDEYLVQFYTKWQIERNYDFAEILATTDNGASWTALCGKYNKPDATVETNDAHVLKSTDDFQDNTSFGQVYDGDSMDQWVMEEIVINTENNSFLLGASNVKFRFRFGTDSDNEFENYESTRDGFFFDDFKIIQVQNPCDNSEPPTNLVLDIATPNSAQVSWDYISSTNYEVRYRVNGGSTWMNSGEIIGNSYILSGLFENTEYEVQVATSCSNVVSAYSSSLIFMTPETICSGNDENSFPYAEGFENNNTGLWVEAANGSEDDFDWDVNEGTTATGNTGPSAASEGVKYLYTEASGANNPNKAAHLISPCFDLTGYIDVQFEFDYHMYGSQMGNLYVDVSTDNGATYNQVLQQLGQAQTSSSDAWTTVVIDLSLYDEQVFKIRLRGETGSGIRSDIAVDNIKLTATSNTLSNDDLTLKKWTINPNPFSDELRIVTNQSTENEEFSIKLFDLRGRMMLQVDKRVNNSELTVSNLSNLESSIYFIEIESLETGQKTSQKVLKQ